MKTITDDSSTLVNAVKSQDCQKDRQSLREPHMVQDRPKMTLRKPDTPECWYCGRKHDLRKRELCPAFEKLCNRCHKPNHFASKCLNTSSRSSVRAINEKTDEKIDDMNEVFPTQIAAVELDDSQMVTLKLKSGNFLRFQVDTGGQCNVVPLALYKEATKDHSLSHIIMSSS